MRDDHGAAEFERVPRHDVGAEQCVVGGMMLSADAVADVLDVIRPSEHYRPAHQIIHEVIIDLYSRGEPFDAVALGAELARRGEIGQVGGAPYLHTCMAAVPAAANAGYYARIVHECYLFRRLEEHGTRALQFARGEGSGEEAVSLVQADAFALTGSEDGMGSEPLTTVLMGATDEVEQIANGDGRVLGVPTGISDLDCLLLGLRKGQMVVVAARPAIGKSCLALDICRSASITHGMTSVIFSLEMGRTEVGMRVMSAEARIPLHTLRSGKLSDEEWGRLAQTIGRIQGAPLWIDASPNITMAEIRSRGQRLKREHDLRLMVVDYLQLMDSPGGRFARGDRREAVDMISRGLKLMAKQLQVPVIAVSQLNRGPEQRHDRRPLLADLRESGQIEQDADVVILIHREDAYERESPRGGEADLIVAKHRNGRTATVTVAFQGHYSRFVDMAQG